MYSICDPVYSSDVLKVSSDLKKKKKYLHTHPIWYYWVGAQQSKIFLRMALHTEFIRRN